MHVMGNIVRIATGEKRMSILQSFLLQSLREITFPTDPEPVILPTAKDQYKWSGHSMTSCANQKLLQPLDYPIEYIIHFKYFKHFIMSVVTNGKLCFLLYYGKL